MSVFMKAMQEWSVIYKYCREDFNVSNSILSFRPASCLLITL